MPETKTRYFRYSTNGLSFAFIKADDIELNALIGNAEEISEKDYDQAMRTMKRWAGATFQIHPTLIIPVDKVMPDFDERTLIGTELGNCSYLWVWRDHLGNVWAETTFLGVNLGTKQPTVN